MSVRFLHAKHRVQPMPFYCRKVINIEFVPAHTATMSLRMYTAMPTTAANAK